MNIKLISILIGLVLFVVGILFFNKINNSKNLTAFEEIKSKINKQQIEIKTKEDAYFRWVKDGYAMLLPATENFYIYNQSNDILDSNKVPALFENEISVVKNILEDRGFILSKENSSKDFSDRTFYDYIQSYEKENDLCVVVVNPDNHVSGYQFSLSCGKFLEKAHEAQVPFLEALDLKGKIAIIRAKNQKDNYYEIGIGYVRGGETAVLKKEGDSYYILYKGQEAPSCELINKENMPDEVLTSIGDGSCFDDNGDYRFKQN